MPYSDPFTALAYGTVAGDDPTKKRYTIGAYDNVLTPQDIALSPNRLKEFPLRSWVQATDAQGNVLGKYRVGDTSYYTEGKPTTDTVEFRDVDRSKQKVFLSPLGPGQVPGPGDVPPAMAMATSAAGGPAGSSNILQGVLDNYGVGGPTGTPTGQVPGIVQPTPGQQFAGNMGDLISKVFAAYGSNLARRKYNPYLPG